MLSSPDSDDIGAQIDLIGVPWLMIGYEPSAGGRLGRVISCLASKLAGG